MSLLCPSLESQCLTLSVVVHLIVVLIRICLSVPSSSRVIFIPVLISHLASTLSATILPALCETLIQIRPNNALVQLRATNVLHTVQRVLMCVVLYEAEATRCLLEAIEAHNEALDLAAFAEKLVYLLFGGVERKVANVKGCRVFELVFGFGAGLAVLVVAAVTFTSSLLDTF